MSTLIERAAYNRTMAGIREGLKALSVARRTAASYSSDAGIEQAKLMTQMREMDPQGHGIVFDTDEGKQAAYISRNTKRCWDADALSTFLKKNHPQIWQQVSSAQLAEVLLNSAIHQGVFKDAGIDLSAFEVDTEGAPFIRFGVARPDSL